MPSLALIDGGPARDTDGLRTCVRFASLVHRIDCRSVHLVGIARSPMPRGGGPDELSATTRRSSQHVGGTSPGLVPGYGRAASTALVGWRAVDSAHTAATPASASTS